MYFSGSLGDASNAKCSARPGGVQSFYRYKTSKSLHTTLSETITFNIHSLVFWLHFFLLSIFMFSICRMSHLSSLICLILSKRDTTARISFRFKQILDCMVLTLTFVVLGSAWLRSQSSAHC